MAKREIDIAGKKLVIHELQDVCDPNTGKALTGSWLWEAAVYLADWVATQSRIEFQLQGKTVLELGAGSGLPGLAAASLGASRVVLTDIAPLLPGLHNNVEANGLGDQVEVRELIWGSDESWLHEVDLVLMSDVFYDPTDMPALVKTLKRVCGRETRVWSASEIRSGTDECLQVLKEQGFEVVELPLSTSPSSTDISETAMEEPLFAVFHIIPPSPTLVNSFEEEDIQSP